MPTTPVAKHLLISGTVQRVGFRNWMERTAPHYQLQGWVRNRLDGSVEAIIRGTREDVQAMIQACYQGPVNAVVAGIEVQDYDGDLPNGFYQIADA